MTGSTGITPSPILPSWCCCRSTRSAKTFGTTRDEVGRLVVLRIPVGAAHDQLSVVLTRLEPRSPTRWAITRAAASAAAASERTAARRRRRSAPSTCESVSGGTPVRLTNLSDPPLTGRSSNLAFEPTFNPTARGGLLLARLHQRAELGEHGRRAGHGRTNDKKRLWVSAIDAVDRSGRSEPPRFLPRRSGHHHPEHARLLDGLVVHRHAQRRARPTVDGDGGVSDAGDDGQRPAACVNGFDCCSGFCEQGVCVDPSALTCAGIDAACTTITSDCCNAGSRVLHQRHVHDAGDPLTGGRLVEESRWRVQRLRELRWPSGEQRADGGDGRLAALRPAPANDEVRTSRAPERYPRSGRRSRRPSSGDENAPESVDPGDVGRKEQG